MKFDDLDKKMRLYETNGDRIYLPEMLLVVRLDGRSFTRFTQDFNFEKPFDQTFRDMMVQTTARLMADSSFLIRYGYTQSDEISLLLDPRDVTFERKERKLISILAGMASAVFSLQAKTVATFDARICQLPTVDLVEDYFRWRAEDATRNALNGYSYWTLRQQDSFSANQASEQLERLSVSDKNELLFTHGINFNDVPDWQKRGIGLYWDKTPKTGFNPKTQQPVETYRNVLKTDYDLPKKDFYGEFIRQILNNG